MVMTDPDKVKAGLRCCIAEDCGKHCPYSTIAECKNTMLGDALQLIIELQDAPNEKRAIEMEVRQDLIVAIVDAVADNGLRPSLLLHNDGEVSIDGWPIREEEDEE